MHCCRTQYRQECTLLIASKQRLQTSRCAHCVAALPLSAAGFGVLQADRERYQVLQQIDRDIERTFTKHPSFKPGTQGVRSLRQVLRAIAMRFRHVGYCQVPRLNARAQPRIICGCGGQGMNFVVAKLLVVTKHGAAHDFSISEV